MMRGKFSRIKAKPRTTRGFWSELEGKSPKHGLDEYPDRVLVFKKRHRMPVIASRALGGGSKMMDFTLTDKDYEEYLRKKEYVSNTRIRPDDMNFFDWLSAKDADMSKTPEGRQLIAALQSIDD
jgi:hypothetical protein